MSSEDAADCSEPAPEDDEEDDNEKDELPPLPVPPVNYPFFYPSLFCGSNSDPDVEQAERPLLPVFDPANLTHFGALPASMVLVHLLQHMQARIQQRRDAAAANDGLKFGVY